MLYREIIAVCSQIHTKYITWIIYKDPIRTAQKTLRLGYTNQSVNGVQGNNRCLFWDPHKILEYIVWAERGILER